MTGSARSPASTVPRARIAVRAAATAAGLRRLHASSDPIGPPAAGDPGCEPVVHTEPTVRTVVAGTRLAIGAR
jgi:hypothetical protein